MKNSILSFLFLFLLSFAQNNLLWQGYFPYNEIKSLSQSPTAVFCCIWKWPVFKDLSTTSIKTTNTVDGLSGQTISVIS
jgi:hypothetical protein